MPFVFCYTENRRPDRAVAGFLSGSARSWRAHFLRFLVLVVVLGPFPFPFPVPLPFRGALALFLPVSFAWPIRLVPFLFKLRQFWASQKQPRPEVWVERFYRSHLTERRNPVLWQD